MTTFPGEANTSATTNQALQHPHMEVSSSNAPAIMARDLVRVFGQKMAVNHLNLTVQRGEFYGFLGPNGAGKSTTIKMMVGLLRPTSGSVWVGGVDVWKDPIRAHSLMGVLPEVLNIYERLSGREFLVFAGHMYGVPAGDIRRRAEDLLQVLTLIDDADKLIVDYSVGMRKKIALAAALIHRPEVIFLDEPFEASSNASKSRAKPSFSLLISWRLLSGFARASASSIKERWWRRARCKNCVSAPAARRRMPPWKTSFLLLLALAASTRI